MTDQAIISGDYVDLRFVKSRKVCQVVIEVPIERGAEIVRAFGTPQPDTTVPVALARLQTAPEPAKERTPFNELKRAQQAGIACNDVVFHAFLRERGDMPPNAFDETFEQQAATAVRKICNVNSRAQFDTNPEAGAKWDSLHSEFRAWQHI